MAKPKPNSSAAPPVDTMPSWQRQHSTYAVGRSHIDGSDTLALEAERKWGVGRLRLLVDNDLRARFDSQRLKLNHAIRHGELEDVKREALRMQNAWRALDAAATQAGAAKLSPLVWEEADDDGCCLAVVRTNADAKHVIAEGRHVEVITMREVVNLVRGFPELVKLKEKFPGCTVERVGPILDPVEGWDETTGDEIPFGEMA